MTVRYPHGIRLSLLTGRQQPSTVRIERPSILSSCGSAAWVIPQIQEASAAAGQVVGFSTYLHGVNYSVEQFRRELDEGRDLH